MGVITATILVGESDIFHDGIIPTHMIFLMENDRPSLTLVPINLFKDKNVKDEKEIIIIPTVENMIDDIFLMIASYVLGVINLKKNNFEKNIEEKKSLYEIFTEEERKFLYRQVKDEIKNHKVKVVFNILNESTLMGQIERIKEYHIETDILVPLVNGK